MKRTLTFAVSCLGLALVAAPLLADWDAGVAAFQAGNLEAAITQFREVVERSPQAPAGHYMLGLSLLNAKHVKEAQGPLAKAVELAPAEARYRLALAQAQVQAGRADTALVTLAGQDRGGVPQELRQAMSQVLAQAATRATAADKALAALEKAVAADPSSKTLWLALSQVADKLNRQEDAFAALSSAYRLDPRDAELAQRTTRAAYSLAHDLDGKAQRDTYLKGFEIAEVWAKAVPSVNAWVAAGEGKMGAQDYADARQWFDKAAAGREPLPHYYLGRCALAEADGRAALASFGRALERQPDAALKREIYAAQGAAYRQLGQFDKAATAYRQAGNGEKAAEMEHFASVQASNEKASAVCLQRHRDLEELRRSSEALRGTPAWDDLERAWNSHLVECAAFLGAYPV